MKMIFRRFFLCFCWYFILFIICLPSDVFAAPKIYITISYSFLSSNNAIPLNSDSNSVIDLQDQCPKKIEQGKTVDFLSMFQEKIIQDESTTWTFHSVEPEKVESISDKVSVKVYWEPKAENQAVNYKISFSYGFDGGWRECIASETVKTEIQQRFPCPQDGEASQNSNVNLDEINRVFANAEINDTENDGVWTTEGYKNSNGNTHFAVVGDTTVTAVWKFKGNKHPVQYRAVSADETKPFPEKLNERIQPAVSQTIEKGDWVRAYAPSELQIEDGTGKWFFCGYNQSFLIGRKENNAFVGKWIYLEETPKVTYKFVSETDNTSLPEEIRQYLPVDTHSYNNGDTVTAIEPIETQYQSKHGEDYSAVNEYWKFFGYDSEQKTMDNKGIEFVGSWKRVYEDKLITLVYASADESEPIPDELYERVSEDFNLDELPEFSQLSLPENRKVFETADSIWTFDRFVYNKSSQNHAAEMYIGYWKFEEKSREVSYAALSLTEEKELPETISRLLPGKTNVGARETKLIPEEPTEKDIRTAEGVWLFRGYQNVSVQPGNSPIIFISEWEYVPDGSVSAVISGDVSLSGRTIREGEFGFLLVRDDEILQTVSNRLDGSFSFAPLGFSAEELKEMGKNGLEYHIMQINGGETKDGTTLDDTDQIVRAYLGERKRGFTVQISGSPSFKNTYSAETVANVTAKVEFSGLELIEGILQAARMRTFSFELYEKDGGSWSHISTAECDEHGTIILQIPFNHQDTGLHCYQIAQTKQNGRNILMDGRRLCFNLNVIDVGDGTLNIEPVYVGESVAAIKYVSVNIPELVFSNRVESEELTVKIQGDVSTENGWQLFADGMPIKADKTLLSQIMRETEGNIIIRGLPSYDSNGEKITWSLQLAKTRGKQFVLADGRVKNSNYAENGDVITTFKSKTVQTGIGFSALLILNGTDSVSDIRIELLKNGTASGHALAIEKETETTYRLRADNLGNGQYTAVANPVPGYYIRYIGSNGEERDNADDGGRIIITKQPETGDKWSVLTCIITGVTAGVILAVCGRKMKRC